MSHAKLALETLRTITRDSASLVRSGCVIVLGVAYPSKTEADGSRQEQT